MTRAVWDVCWYVRGMLQNREVGGATMGAGRGGAGWDVDSGQPTTRRHGTTQPRFGPLGYLNLAVPTAVAALFLSVLALRFPDPLGMRWSWATLLLVLAFGVLSRATRGLGAETDLRFRNGPRNVTYRAQSSATWVVLGMFAVAFVGYLASLPVLVFVMVGLACGVTAGLAPTYFQSPPAAAHTDTAPSERSLSATTDENSVRTE